MVAPATSGTGINVARGDAEGLPTSDAEGERERRERALGVRCTDGVTRCVPSIEYTGDTVATAEAHAVGVGSAGERDGELEDEESLDGDGDPEYDTAGVYE